MNQTLLAITEEINVYIKNAEEDFQHDYSKITEMSIQYISKRLEEVKQKFEQNLEIDPDTEIFYFKHIKCHLLALIQYYSLVQKIELDKPPIKKKGVKKYYLKTLFKIKKKLSHNKFFYNYFKSNSSQFDDHSFVDQLTIYLSQLQIICSKLIKTKIRRPSMYLPRWKLMKCLDII
ncbi:hypothetical protein L950_0217010 [Sphingobacterium sp. IITKGP-BTPF85]|nr:hypothetical protein L950_0217010 [Sphingobacterium sp. IITKGP-BTPF85]